MNLLHYSSRLAAVSLLALLTGASLLLTQCGDQSAFRTSAALENPATEAVMRHLFANCPVKAEVKVICPLLTEKQLEPTVGFREKLKDLGPKIIRMAEVNAVKLADVIRMVTKEHGLNGRELVMLLQVSELTKKDETHFHAVGAWSYKDDMMRQEFDLTKAADGSYSVVPGKVLEKKPSN